MYSNLKQEDPWIQIEIARQRIAKDLPVTLLRRGRKLPTPAEDFKVWYKCDHLRMTGSFKERGALNALLRLTEAQRKAGVIAASAGNHSQALSYHGQRLSIPVTVVMPTTAPIIKVENCRSMGANVILHGRTFHEAMLKATEISIAEKLRYINGFNDPDIIAGAGTIGLEIMTQLPQTEVIVVPVGGGGLVGGIALAVKRLNPHVLIIGVESERCPSMTTSLKAGKPIFTDVEAGGTLADGLAVPEVGPNCLEIVKTFVDEMITVPEHDISVAILHLLEKEKLLVEGGGCAGLAGLLSGKLDHLKQKKIVTVLCGGNIDMTILGRVIQRGLYSTGRLMQFDCAISDRVGGLARFTHCLAKTNASVKEIVQEQPFINDVKVCSVHLTVETLSREHQDAVVRQMAEDGYMLKVIDGTKYDDVKFSKL